MRETGRCGIAILALALCAAAMLMGCSSGSADGDAAPAAAPTPTPTPFYMTAREYRCFEDSECSGFGEDALLLADSARESTARLERVSDSDSLPSDLPSSVYSSIYEDFEMVADSLGFRDSQTPLSSISKEKLSSKTRTVRLELKDSDSVSCGSLPTPSLFGPTVVCVQNTSVEISQRIRPSEIRCAWRWALMHALIFAEKSDRRDSAWGGSSLDGSCEYSPMDLAMLEAYKHYPHIAQQP